MSQNLRLLAGSLADPNCWPASPQLLYQEMFDRGSALIGDITGVIISDSAPGINDRDKAWIKTSGSGAPVWYPFIYNSGKWISPHPTPPSGSERRIWVGLETDLPNYDGGDTGGLSAASGPMWEVDHAFDGLFPLGAGTIPGSGGASVAVGASVDSLAKSGEYAHTLTMAELPDANLNMPLRSGFTDMVDPGTLLLINPAVTSFPDFNLSVKFGGGGAAHNNMPPYYGVYFIKRTIRVYVVGA